MPTFVFTARSSTGEEINDTREAKDERELARALRQEGNTLISASSQEVRRKKEFRLTDFWSGLFGVSLTERLMFTRNLKVMVSAGMPMPRTLGTLADQTGSKKFRAVLSRLQEKILQGESLSGAMGEHPQVFSELFTNMIRVGEESGTLEEVLTHLTVQMEREHDLKSKVKGALMYPAVIVVAMVGVGTLMLILVVPTLAQTFQDLNIDLPFTTQMIIALGDFMSERWYVVFGGVLGLVGVLLRAFKGKKTRKVLDTLFLRLPIISGIVKKTNTAFTARTLSSLMASSVPMVRSLEITSRVLGNVYFRRALEESAVKVGRGGKLSEALTPYEHLYPPLVIQMIGVGEETGQTPEILLKLAEFFEDEVNTLTRNLATIIEPLLMILIGIVVGFFAVSMLQPMYGMLQTI